MSGLIYRPEYDKGSQAREMQNAFDERIKASREGQAGLQKLGVDIANARWMAAAKAKQDIYGSELGQMADGDRQDIEKLRNDIRDQYLNGDFARDPFKYQTMLKGLNDHITRSTEFYKNSVGTGSETGEGGTYNDYQALNARGEFYDHWEKQGYDVTSDNPMREQQETLDKVNNHGFHNNVRFDENGVIVADQLNPETGEVMGSGDISSMPHWEMASSLFMPGLQTLSPASLYDVAGSKEVQTRLTQIETGIANNVGSVNYAENYGDEPQEIQVALMTDNQKQNYISDTYFDDMVSSSVHKDTSGARSFRRSLANEMGLDAQSAEFQLFVEGRYDELSETAVGQNMMRNARNKWREVSRKLKTTSASTTGSSRTGVAGDSRYMVLGGLQDPSSPEQNENAINIQAGVLPYGNMTGYSFVDKNNNPEPISFEGSAFDGGKYDVSAVFYEVDETAVMDGREEPSGKLVARVVVPEREVVEYRYIDADGNEQFTENEAEARAKNEGPYESKTRTRKVESKTRLVPLDEGIGSQGEEIIRRMMFGADKDVFMAQMEQLKQVNTVEFWKAKAAQDEALAQRQQMDAAARFQSAIPMDQMGAITQEIEDIQRRMTAYRPAEPGRYNSQGVLVEEARPESDNLQALKDRLNELKTSEFVTQDADGNNVYTPVSKIMEDNKAQARRNEERVEAEKVSWRNSPIGTILTATSDEPGSSFNAMTDEQGRALVSRLEKGGTVKISADALNWAMENMPDVGRTIRQALKGSPMLGGAFNVKPETYASIAEKEIYKALDGLADKINEGYKSSNRSSEPAPVEPEDDGLTFPDQPQGEPTDYPNLPPEVEETRRASNEAIINLPPAIRDQVTSRIDEIRRKTGKEVRIQVGPNAAGDANLVTFVDATGAELSEDPILFDI